eukprot:TRINITY_DN7069_c0_g1_i3.p1 TRINITY_DN7069_c0_g1~~TRINITY_DN7069_c0_g1_i3.p1  ORF type:complete len:535 (-),score=119.21 TRINITY_DN7069_c0_g1_i3:242-1846(-)
MCIRDRRWTEKFDLQCSVDIFKVVELMKTLKPIKTRTPLDYNKLFRHCEKLSEAKLVLNDEEIFPKIVQEFSVEVLDAITPLRKDPLAQRLFTNSFFFDVLVSVLVREIVNPTFRPYITEKKHRKVIAEQMIKQVMERVDKKQCNSQYQGQLLSQIGYFEFRVEGERGQPPFEYRIDLKHYAKKPRWVPEVMKEYGIPNFIGFNSNGLFNGPRGIGKSCALLYSTIWALKNDWIVAKVPSAWDWTHRDLHLDRHPLTGLYLQYQLAREFLADFRRCNLEKIREIPVNMSLYGHYNYSGVHKDDPDPNPKLWDPERQIWSNSWEKFVDEDERYQYAEKNREMSTFIAERLQNPKTLLDIVDFGIKEKNFSIGAVYELLEQLYNLESHCVLIAVDDFNWFYRPSSYPSFRYASQKGMESSVPPYHLSLCRAFMNFDGHKIRNGIKLASTSFKKLYRHDFDIDKINFARGYEIALNSMPLDDFRRYMYHANFLKLWKEPRPSFFKTDLIYLATQGNYGETISYLDFGSFQTAQTLNQ